MDVVNMPSNKIYKNFLFFSVFPNMVEYLMSNIFC